MDTTPCAWATSYLRWVVCGLQADASLDSPGDGMASCGVSWDFVQKLWLTCIPWSMGLCGWAKVMCPFWVWAFDCKGGWLYSALSLVWRHLGWRQLLQPHRRNPLHESHRTKIMVNHGNEGLLKILWDTDNEWARWGKKLSCFQPLGFEVVFYCSRTKTCLVCYRYLHTYPDVWIFRKSWEFCPHEDKFPTRPWEDGLSGSFIGGRDCASCCLLTHATITPRGLCHSESTTTVNLCSKEMLRDSDILMREGPWHPGLGMVDAHTVFATNELLCSRNDKISGRSCPHVEVWPHPWPSLLQSDCTDSTLRAQRKMVDTGNKRLLGDLIKVTQ